MNKFENKKALLVSLTISLGTGLLSGLFVLGNFNAYSQLIKPPLTPPSWVFPVVWTILYTLMGISAYMIYVSKSEERFASLTIYITQLIFNFLWSIIYFNMMQLLFAFVWLVILWILILIMIVNFYKINKLSAYLQIPYFLWVTFAGYLNLALYLINV